MISILEKYLQTNNYFRIPKTDLKLQLISHPDYPSLKSITDTLDYFGIDNIAINAPKEALEQLPTSFLALLNHHENNSGVMVTKRNNKIILHFEDGHKKSLSENEFKEVWTGSIMAIEEATDKKKVALEHSSVLIFLLVSAFLLLQTVSFNLFSFVLSILSLAGIGLSYFIVNEEMGIHNKTVAKVCRAVSKTSTCSEVIKTASSKLFDTIALSDVCVVFFTSCFLTFSLFGVNYTFLLGIALLSLPVVIFSFYQQAIVLKKWCALCLGIVGVLFFQDMVALLMTASVGFSTDYFTKAIFLFFVTGATWHLVKPIVVSNLKLVRIQSEFLKFKRNQNLFQALLQSGKVVDNTLIPTENEIYFGTENPIITIQAITNPLCGFCTESFKTHHKLLATHHSKVRINFIFSVQVNNKENKATQIASRVVEIYGREGKEKAWESLQAWFSTRDIEKWQSQYGIAESISDDSIETLLKHGSWCAANKIAYTPATVIEDHLFPQEYQISDLLLLMDDIILEKTKSKEPEFVHQE